MKVLYIIEAETGRDGDIGKSEAAELAAHLSRYQTWKDNDVRVWNVAVYEVGPTRTEGRELRHNVLSHLAGYQGQDPASFRHRRRGQSQKSADN